MKEHYQCEVALKSPAHITLIPPFWMKPEIESELIHSLLEFSITQAGIHIQLNNFSYFKPRVIFVNVVQNEDLLSLKNNLLEFLSATKKFPLPEDDRLFYPHVTIATKDLHKKTFYEAWEFFKEKQYSADWRTEGISLLRHNKKNWDVIFTSQFKKS